MKILPSIFFTSIFLTIFLSTATGQIIKPPAHGVQKANPVISTAKGLCIEQYIFESSGRVGLVKNKPLFSVVINGGLILSSHAKKIKNIRAVISFNLTHQLTGTITVDPDYSKGWKARVSLANISDDTLIVENFVPFGESANHIYITSSGPWNLARSKLFRSGLVPIGVILPDNAWELGYASVELEDDKSVCALSRRTAWENAKRRRYKTELYPDGKITWTIWMESFTGEWQNGLKRTFQERWLYDLETFDNSLFERDDLQWIKDKYLLTLQMAWDHQYYDAVEGKYKLDEFLKTGKELMGGYDVYSIWPTWPRLGVDQRNQWDLYEDLPGGLEKMRELSQMCQDLGTKFFIAFNPWDQSTRKEDPFKGMARLIEATNADGVVLDTRGSSSHELQQAADSVRAGVIMYSEGMAIPKDMPGIIAGRVHDAIYMPPPLNLNKLIKPDFSIFRVCQLSQGRIHREAAISLFNGYGIELNTYYPGRPEWMEEEFIYLGKIVKVLRENSDAFNSTTWTPLLPSIKDSIWVNEFPTNEKTIYTIYSLIPEGFSGALFPVEIPDGHHAVSLWRHEALALDTIYGEIFPPVYTSAFDKTWLGTRRESNVDVIAILPELLKVKLELDSLFVSADVGNKIVISAGNPTYQTEKLELTSGDHSLKLYDHFKRYEGKIVVQLFNSRNQLMDEQVAEIEAGLAILISKLIRTAPIHEAPAGMVEIPSGSFVFEASNKDQFIPYPKNSEGNTIHIQRFFMDKYLVSNDGYYQFVTQTNYSPEDKTNYLHHWRHGLCWPGSEHFPIAFVSLEDAKEFCNWAGKRLPTEAEWQYAAQSTDGRKWPWGNRFDSTLCNNATGHPTPVGMFPAGASPFGVEDMVGNLWQFTQDVYDNGCYYYAIMKGGSYYKPTSSWWYVQGGPQPVNHQQMLLLVSPGFDRNATVGFRCVKDAE